MKSKILIIDDEESIRFAFELILTEYGYDVETAISYETALQMVSKNEPDLILSDIVLGNYTGIDLLSEIKKRNLNCPVIMITGEPNIETSAEALRLGAFDYIPKPIRKDTLIRISSHGIQHKKLLDTKKRLELENINARRKMEAIFRSLKDAVITVDKDLQIIEANEAATQICNCAVKDMKGKSFETLPSGCNRVCVQVLKETLRTKKESGEHRVECGSEGTTQKVVVMTGIPLRDDESGIHGAVLVVRDITRITHLEKQLQEQHQFHRIIGKSDKMKKMYALMENLSDTDTTVLITGETGTGKELAAHAIHHNSTRKKEKFVKINCSALAENLLESELFGHVKGAFTGAVKDREGRFKMADGGTLFLDEIGDISPLIQLKLLRVIQEKEFERVGEATPIKVDVRIIAATNCNLKEKVKQGDFREDLYYRINVVDFTIPPLRERREDIPLLADHFMETFNTRFKKQIEGFSNEVVNAFMSYSWPGNIRELEHAVEHGFVLCRDKTMLFEHLPVEIKDYITAGSPALKTKKTIEKHDIIEALTKTGWNKSKAARLLGINRRTLYRKLKEHHISNP